MNWLNGKKSIIALILWMVTAAFCMLTGQEVAGFVPPETWGEYVSTALEGLALIFGTVGLLHKFIKKYVTVAVDK